jgi:hypothetical protein
MKLWRAALQSPTDKSKNPSSWERSRSITFEKWVSHPDCITSCFSGQMERY